MRWFQGGAVVVFAALALAGCSGPEQDDGPDPLPENIIDPATVRVIRMPEGFRNVAMTCDGSTGIYVTSRGCESCTTVGSGIAVVLGDPRCAR